MGVSGDITGDGDTEGVGEGNDEVDGVGLIEDGDGVVVGVEGQHGSEHETQGREPQTEPVTFAVQQNLREAAEHRLKPSVL